MPIRTTVAAVALLALALTACSSSDDQPDTTSTTASATPTATVDQQAAEQACVDAWKKVFESTDGKGGSDPDNAPAGCAQLPTDESRMLWLKAHKEYLARNRECAEDPSCTLLPSP